MRGPLRSAPVVALLALLALLAREGTARAEVFAARAVAGGYYAVLDPPAFKARALAAVVLAPGEERTFPAEDLPPGEYRARVTLTTAVDEAAAAVVTRVLALAGGAEEEPRRFRVTTPGRYAIRVENRSSAPVLAGNVAFLAREARDPVQVVLLVPDAFALFAETHPTAPFGFFRGEGAYHDNLLGSGDNTLPFTNQTFVVPTAPGEPPMPEAMRQRGLFTASVSDNFYLLSYVEKRLFDYLLIVNRRADEDADVRDRALRFVEARRDEDFFLYVHLPAEHDVGYVNHQASMDHFLIAQLADLRRALPGAVILMMPDHGSMHRHAWGRGGKMRGGQGWGLYTDTARVPLLALGPGIEAGRTCSQRAASNDLRDHLALVGADGADPLVDFLNCESPPRDLVVREGFKGQLSVTTDRFHYIRYNPTVAYPQFSVATGESVRERFLDGEALFDMRADAENTRSVGALHPDELLALRSIAVPEISRRAGGGAGDRTILHFFWHSRTCEAPPAPLRVVADTPLGPAAGAERGAAIVATAAGTLATLRAPYCYNRFSLEAGEPITDLIVDAPGTDLFLGRGYLRRRERATLSGPDAVGVLNDYLGRGFGDLFVDNGARGGLYVLAEQVRGGRDARPSAARGGADVPLEEVKRMMRSWGYMKEADLFDER
ncbi:sulfatase-like hydrolase/transferase [Sorangium sp. So ce1182]|uniref:sulfatase-like hydrolase/transferase n=1 Tax=Sorangium sp. So ce1182 TaxID=3133334 RepID=UPI003F6105B3